MITTYGRSGPPTPLIIVMAIALVLGCFLLWMGTLRFLDSGAGDGQQNAASAQDDDSQAGGIVPTFDLGPTPTPVPACQPFEVSVESALMRRCPDDDCDIRESLPFEATVCVYGRAEDAEYDDAANWYVVDLNADGAFRDLVFMHESVLRPLEPTPAATDTRPALPTITLTPTPSISATPPFSNVIPIPSVTPSPPIQPSPTLERPEF